MSVEITSDQEFLLTTVRRFLDQTSPVSTVRELATDPLGCDPSWWQRGAELGWTSMLVSQCHGGGSLGGQGLLDLAMVSEAMGERVQPGPLLPVNVVAEALERSGSARQQSEVLPSLASGETVATWCFAEASDIWRPDGMTTTALPDEKRFVLNGTKWFVQDALWAAHLLVTAASPEGPTQFLIGRDTPGVSVQPMECLDVGRRLYVVRFDRVVLGTECLVGGVGRAWADVERQLQVALVVQNAETVGLLDRIFQLTVDYATERVAFGRPIGSYQAIKHRLADMHCLVEAAKATATASAQAVQVESDEADVLISVAKSYIGEVARSLVSECQQIFGGIAMTWEHDLHLYHRRATLNGVMYGSASAHRARLHDLLAARTQG